MKMTDEFRSRILEAIDEVIAQVRAEVTKHQLTSKRVCEESGVSEATMSRAVWAGVRPNVKTALKLEKWLFRVMQHPPTQEE